MNILLLLFILALVVTSGLWVHMEKKRAALRILFLKKAADTRIEEARIESARETSGKIGQNLHDELSPSLAALIHHMEILSLQTSDNHLQKSIEHLKFETGKVYESIRQKSHTLYRGSAADREKSFEESIVRITGFLLPDALYRKETDIDPNAVSRLSKNQQNEILLILKESATNILKHARNATEVFVFLYEGDNREIIFQVGDNGNTFQQPTDGIGLSSIRKRVTDLKGTFKIETGGGTVLTVTLPEEEIIPELPPGENHFSASFRQSSSVSSSGTVPFGIFTFRLPI